MFDPTKPYCRRDGKPAKIVYTLENGDHVVISRSSIFNVEFSYIINSNGHKHDDAGLALINIPEKIEGWVVIYSDLSSSSVYSSLEIVQNGIKLERKYGCINQLACIKVSFTEGEGLE